MKRPGPWIPCHKPRGGQLALGEAFYSTVGRMTISGNVGSPPIIFDRRSNDTPWHHGPPATILGGGGSGPDSEDTKY
eukprot:714896-Pyramimonas_sp.AAC.1